jgi:hypothetical protein
VPFTFMASSDPDPAARLGGFTGPWHRATESGLTSVTGTEYPPNSVFRASGSRPLMPRARDCHLQDPYKQVTPCCSLQCPSLLLYRHDVTALLLVGAKCVRRAPFVMAKLVTHKVYP